jgi:hypothetical protein
MSGRNRKTQRRQSSASEGAGGASLAAAGMLAPPAGLEELYAALSSGNISWGTMAELNMEKVKKEGLGAALLALRAPKKLSRKEYKALYAKQAAEAAERRAAQSTGRSRTPSSEIRRRRSTLKKATKTNGGH